MVVGQLGHIMVSVADTMMVGRVGVLPLAASTFAGSIYHVLMMFGMGVSYAITPLVAATDSGDQRRLMRLLQSGLVLNVLLSLVLMAIALAISPFLMHFGQEASVAMAARPYLILVSSSIVPLMVFQTYRQYAEGMSNTFHPMVVSILANLLNVGLNYVLIYGKLGFAAQGLNGAGWATLISRVVMSLLMIWMIRKGLGGFRLEVDWNNVKRMLKIGLPSGLQYTFEVGAFATAAIMCGWISAEALAAHQIAINLAAISFMCATGMAAASTVRIGNQMGLKDLPNLKLAGYTSLITVALFMGLVSVMLIILRDALVGLYVNDAYVQLTASGLLVIAAAFQVSDGLQAVGLGVLRGLTDVNVPTLVTFVAYWLVAIPGGYVLGFQFGLGVDGIWYALSGGLTVAAMLHILRFRSLTKRLHF